MLLPTDLLGNVSLSNDGFTLSTGSSDRAASSLGSFAMDDREFLKPYGTEGSAATIGNLTTGTYSFDWSMYSKDTNGWDKLYAWNGKELTLIGDRTNGTQISPARWTHDSTVATVDIIYDYVTFIALDENSKTGTTEFTINNFDYLEALPYEAPVAIGLNPDYLLGDIDIKDGYTSIGTGTGDRAVSTLSQELGIDLSDLGTEGSLATWNLENGIYELTWKVYQSEDQRDRDKIYLFDGNELQFFADGSESVQTSATRYQTDWVTTEVEVTNGELTFLALDEIDKSGTTQLRIQSLERVASFQEPEPEIQEISFDTVPEDGMGAISGSSLSTGEGAVSAETLTSDFFHNSVDIGLYGFEGTAALWTTEPGIQQITWSISTDEDPEGDILDQFLLWDGEGLSKLGDISLATIYNETDLITTTVETYSDEWGIVALDSVDDWGESIITIHELKWLSEGVSEGVAEQLPEPNLEPIIDIPFGDNPFNDPDPDPILLTEQALIGKLGSYEEFVDPVDFYEIPLGYNEGVEGFINVINGSDLTLDIYDSNGFYDSYSVGSSVSFNLGSDTFFIEVYPDNPNVLTEYSLNFNLGQVYDPS